MIKDDSDFDANGLRLRQLLSEQKAISSSIEDEKKAAYNAHRSISSLESERIRPLRDEIDSIKAEMVDYFDTSTSSRRSEMIQSRDIKITKLREAGLDDRADELAASPIVITEPSSGYVSVDIKLGYRITDMAEVRVAYMQPDAKAIRTAVQEFGEMAPSIIDERIQAGH